LHGNAQVTVGRSSAHSAEVGSEEADSVFILGVILLVIGLIANIGILTTIGIILLVIGAVLWLLGSTGRAIGGRRHYW
jgi:hypothetical protein